MRTKLLALVLFVSMYSLLQYCNAQDTASFFPADPYPRQIVLFRGNSGEAPSSIHWGMGNPDENRVDHSRPKAKYFQIPANAQQGLQQLEIRRPGGPDEWDTLALDVRPFVGAWPDPRIEDISIHEFTMMPSGKADVLLFISVANVDAKAKVRVNNALAPSVLYSALVTDLFNRTGEGLHDARTYGYPVFHYGGLLVSLHNKDLGSNLLVEVKNVDGSLDTMSYSLPITADVLDSDNDGLYDAWELNGYPVPNSTEVIDLPAMGCTPKRKDILVEVDWMQSANPTTADGPGQNYWETVMNVFKNSPVLNPDGSAGISLHIDRGQHRSPTGPTGPFANGGTVLFNFEYMDFGPPWVDSLRQPNVYRNFCFLKSLWFAPAREQIFHYCIFGMLRPNGSGGRGEAPGNDFMITAASLPVWQFRSARVGLFIHELGHNLGLHHNAVYKNPPDGISWDQAWTNSNFNETHKPNHPSTMNYLYQFAGVSRDCDVCSDLPIVHTYSQGMLKSMDEQDVDEQKGFCGNVSNDFNRDGFLSPSIIFNLNGNNPIGTCYSTPRSFDVDETDFFTDYNEWGSLQLNWRKVIRSPFGCN